MRRVVISAAVFVLFGVSCSGARVLVTCGKAGKAARSGAKAYDKARIPASHFTPPPRMGPRGQAVGGGFGAPTAVGDDFGRTADDVVRAGDDIASRGASSADDLGAADVAETAVDVGSEVLLDDEDGDDRPVDRDTFDRWPTDP